MTKKYLIALADALRAEKPAAHWDANKMVHWELDVKAVANVAAMHNPKFDRARFVSACNRETKGGR